MRQDLVKKIQAAIPGNSIGRYDLLPLFADAGLFSQIVRYISAEFIGKCEYIASPEATGWILGTALAKELGVGFIALRKGNKLPYPRETISSASYLDYSGDEKSLELVAGSLAAGSKVLIVDEWIETGASIRACMALLEREGCLISGLATIGINDNDDTKRWIDDGFVTFIGMDI